MNLAKVLIMDCKTNILIILLIFSLDICKAQDFNSTIELLGSRDSAANSGELSIYQDPGIDSLIGRYILYNLRLNGVEGFRIQIYNSSDKNAREESGRIRAEFISKFPDIASYASFDRPGYYKIRVGDFRSRVDGIKDLLMIRKEFPDAYLVPDIINFQDLNKK
jgi:hypothetical protein